jgi:hypothetical protein
MEKYGFMPISLNTPTALNPAILRRLNVAASNVMDKSIQLSGPEL